MGELPRTQADRTLGMPEVLPFRVLRSPPLSWARVPVAAVAVFALVVALAAVSAALDGIADAGVETQGPGSVVTYVNPLGYAYREGVRMGDAVIALRPSDEAGGWRLVAQGTTGTKVVEAAPYDRSLKDSLPLAVFAFLCSTAGLLLRERSVELGWVLASVALTVATTPLVLHGDLVLSTIGIAGSTAVPLFRLAGRLGGMRRTIAVGALTVLVLGAWVALRLQGDGRFEMAEGMRQPLNAVCLGLMAVIAVFRARPTELTRPRLATSDLLAIGVALGLAVGLVFLGHVPVIAVGMCVLALALVFPAWRRQVVDRTDRLLLADVRQRAALAATEVQRARLAADLHDAPLQELGGVIARLEGVPWPSESWTPAGSQGSTRARRARLVSPVVA